MISSSHRCTLQHLRIYNAIRIYCCACCHSYVSFLCMPSCTRGCFWDEYEERATLTDSEIGPFCTLALPGQRISAQRHESRKAPGGHRDLAPFGSVWQFRRLAWFDLLQPDRVLSRRLVSSTRGAKLIGAKLLRSPARTALDIVRTGVQIWCFACVIVAYQGSS